MVNEATKECVDGTNDDEGGYVIEKDEDEDEDEIPEGRGRTEGVEIMSLDVRREENDLPSWPTISKKIIIRAKFSH